MSRSALVRTLAASLAAAFFCLTAGAQQAAPRALPYTMTTLAGTTPMSSVTGTQCPNLPTGTVSKDAYGDGCLATNAIFGAGGRGGVQVDGFGNVFVADDVNSIVHMIDPSTGLVTRLAGQGTVCAAASGVGTSGAVDSSGDGCLAATQTKTASPRGIGIDPYGNVLLAGYGDNAVHMVCRAASPLCTPAMVGTMQLVAGCVKNAGSGPSGGVGVDGVQAAQTFVTAGCTTSNGEVSGPRGATADIYGNVYFADTNTSRTRVVVGPLTSTYFTGSNPLYAALGVYYANVQAGHVYTVVNLAGTSTSSGGTPTVSGAACSSTVGATTYSGTASDTFGDGCPFNSSSVKASSGYTSGVAVDAAGNMLFTDPTHGLRVLYVNGTGTAGTLMKNAIIANNAGVTPQVGFIYLLWGNGATALGSAPTLGTATAASDTTTVKLTVSPQGDVFIGDASKVVYFDLSTGYVRLYASSSSNVTTGNYCSGSAGQTSLSAYSDGCAISKSIFSNNNGMGVAADTQGNLYLYDATSNTSGMLVRKVLAQGMASQTLGTAYTQTYALHFNEAAAGTVGTPTAVVTSTPDMTAGAISCGAQNADNSVDCTVPVTTTPSAPGVRGSALVAQLPISGGSTGTVTLNLAGVVQGSALAVDSAASNGTALPLTTATLASGAPYVGVAADGAGNIFTMNTQAKTFAEYLVGSGSGTLTGTIPTSASQLAVDRFGNVYAVGKGSSSIVELAVSGPPASANVPAAYAAGSISYLPASGTAAPAAIAVDAAGNLFVADVQSSTANTSIIRIAQPGTAAQQQTTIATGFTNPVSLAVDPSGNVYVADQGAPAVYKLTPGIVNGVPGYTQSTVALTNVTPVAVATDAAGDLYVQDAASLSVVEVPVSGPTTTVLTGLTTPSGLAVDGVGNVYSADAGQSLITKVTRNATAFNFGTGAIGSPTLTATLSNVGNQAATGSNTVTNTTNFAVVGGATNGCSFSASVLGAQSSGNACTLQANFVGAGSGTVSDVLTYLPASSTVGSLTLSGTLAGTAIATTTTISTPTPATPVYVSGTEVTFTVKVTPASGTQAPGGTVAVTVDSTVLNPTLTPSGSSGVATVTLSGLSAGPHSISAIYPTSGTFTGSNSGTATSFSIAQATTAIAWTPAATSVPFSAPIGASVLNATATSSGAAVPGAFVYTANGSEVNAGSYLAIGNYALGVTFVPTDTVNYATSTATAGTLQVAKATTTAALGVTQNLVASDGSGNYTTLQAAINALPNTGGNVYIKPGTYNGFVTVVKPNVGLYGLGGDPTKVVVTNEDGAFSPPYPAGAGAGNNGSNGDQGSATMVVARGTVGSFTGTPNGFYGENFTVANTYDTDTTTTTTNALVGGTCTANQPATPLATLYNNGTLCNSQALAMWITSDQAVLNNVYAVSQQDTIYAGAISGSSAYAARQFWFRGKVTGDVDYIFGDAAAVFDHTSIYTTYHGNTATGTETIEAQNQRYETGASPSYLSGYVMNSDVFTSQSSGMTNLYFGRPYGQYSTWIMLNSYIDQVNPTGYIEFQGDTNLPTSTYTEYNNIPYTDPATGAADLNGVLYQGAGGSTGQGVTGTREVTSQDPGTLMAQNAVKTAMTQAQAQAYYPYNFLSATVPVSPYNTVSNWDPTAAIASGANNFVPAGNLAVVPVGTSMTIVLRPQTPGLGAVTNGTYTIPTGTYTLTDNYNGQQTQLATGSLDAAGEAYVTLSTLQLGVHQLTWSYSGDANFSGATTSSPYTLNVVSSGTTPVSMTLQPSSSAVYGGAATVAVSVTATSGTTVPTGQVFLTVDGGSPLTGTLSGSGSYIFTLSGLAAGNHTLSATYTGDTTFATKTLTNGILVAKAVLQVTANNYTVTLGQSLPTFAATYTGFVNGDTQSVLSGTPSLTVSPATPTIPGDYTIVATTGTLAATNYTFAFTNGVLQVTSSTQLAAVATGDTRTVTEPSFPAACQVLTASIARVGDDIPAAVDATVTNPDGARIQAALNACAGTNQAVELSTDGNGHDSFLSGPLNMPAGVTLLVDPQVVLFFSRNAQDYDVTQGTHTCGTVNSASATSSCLPLINISNVSNVGIMGYGKLDGRGGDTVMNTFPSSFNGDSWWGLSAAANGTGNQQNPRFVQITQSSNVTLYKITLRDSPLFHVSMTGGQGVNGLTIWDAKIVTPTSSRNTDGIDPGQAQNVTVTRSWVSDGDDNIAVGASGTPGTTALAQNISITNNHFFAGHGESIGSITDGGVSNVLFDGNMLSGNKSVDSNSTGIRIKSANDRGGLVTGIQYSNSCFQNHATLMQFTPLYNTNTGTLTPNFTNILLQNLTFLTSGTVGLSGASNNGTVNPLGITMDNVSFASLASSNVTPAPTNVAMTYGAGGVSSNFTGIYAGYVGANGNTLTDNTSAASQVPPVCNFIALAPELTGPSGQPQTIVAGQSGMALLILTPAVGGAAYPTGSVTLYDGTTALTTVTLTGTTDTTAIPLTGLAAGTHTLTASYAGDANYVPATQGQPYLTTAPYVVTVVQGSLASSTTTLAGVPTASTFGNSFTATATVTGTNPTGTVSFLVNGIATETVSLSGAGMAQTTLNLSPGTYTITALYSGDAVNAGSSSAVAPLSVTSAITTTTLSANNTTTTLGVPVTVTATVSSAAGTPSGTVTFTYTNATTTTAVTVATITTTTGVANAAIDLPIGVNNLTATYAGSGNFLSSTSTALPITVNPPVNLPLPATPMTLPYIISTIAGGASANCSSAADKYGDGCQGTQIAFSSGDDLRSVVADPFGNVYVTDASASLIRRIAPNGVISQFAGYVSGTSCVPSGTTGCVPTQVKLNKPRGIATDTLGDLFIAGYSDNKVYEYKVATGLLYVIAGNGTKPSTQTAANGDGGAALAAQLNGPRGVWADPVGNIYIADTGDNKIRVVDTTGNISTFAGTGVASSTGDGGAANLATINNPQGVLSDANSNVYIADSQSVRVVCVTCLPGSGLYQLLTNLGITSPQNGNIYTIAGGGTTAYTGQSLGTTIPMSPQKLAMDAESDLYISDGNGVVWFVDSRTGYVRAIAGNSKTACATGNSVGDGCPATQALIGNGGNGIGVGSDVLGNLYISDTLNLRVRKVSTGLVVSTTAVGASSAQPLDLHFITGDAAATANAFVASSPEWTLGTPACTMNADTTVDCMLTATFAPAVPGARSTPLTVTSAQGNTASLGLVGTALGAGSTLDPATQISFGTGLQVAGLATDNAGNVYVADLASKSLLRYAKTALTQGTAATATTLATLTAPAAVAVDARGYAYVADSSTGHITHVSPSGATSMLAASFKSPAGLAVDTNENLYVADSAAQTVTAVNLITGATQVLAVGTLQSPTGLALDPAGNLLVSDPSAGVVYRYNLSTGASTTVATPASKPAALAVDAAGNLLVDDSAAIDAVPASANSTAYTVASLTPAALAIDAAGNLYTGSNGGVVELVRTQGALQFTPSSTAMGFNILSSGNQALTLSSLTQTDSTDYAVSVTASADCTLLGTLPSAIAAGGACVGSASYTATASATSDVVTLNGNLSNAALSTPNTVQLTLTGTAQLNASITLGAFSPVAPVYGQSVTVSATVAGSGATPAGTVTFTVDSTQQSATLSGGAASSLFTGLSVGQHTVTASYVSTNGFTTVTSSTVTLTVGKATPTITLQSSTTTTALSPVTFTATLSSTAGTPTGTVTFYNGTAVLGSSSLTSGVATLTTSAIGSGSSSVTAVYSGDVDFITVTSSAVALNLGKATPTITLQSSATTTTALSSVTFTATVAATAGTPTGTVTFFNGSVALGTSTLSGGKASLAVTTLGDGTQTITAVYSGDANFVSVTSSAVTETIEDFVFSLGNASTSLTVMPGGTVKFLFTVTPVGSSTFPGVISFSLSGLPSNASYAFLPNTITAGSGATSVQLTIYVPGGTQALNGMQINTGAHGAVALGGAMPPAAASHGHTAARLALLSLPMLLGFAGAKRRRLRQLALLSVLLAAASLGVVNLTGCSGGNQSTAASTTYNLTLTATSGGISHNQSLTLTVQ